MKNSCFPWFAYLVKESYIKIVWGLLLIYTSSSAQETTFSDKFSISGIITQLDSGIPLQGINIKVFLLSDTTISKTTSTDETGFYLLSDFFVNLKDDPNQNGILIKNNNKQIDVTVFSNEPVHEASVYNLTGQKLMVIKLQQIGFQMYTGFSQTNTNQIIVIKAGKFSAKHFMLFSKNYTESIKNAAPSNRKSATSFTLIGRAGFDFRFFISHPDTLFQPIDTIIQIMEIENNYTQNFAMQQWPVFWARVGSVIFDDGIPTPDADIWFTNLLDTTKVYQMPCYHSSGGVYLVDLPIPAKTYNRLLPDTILWRVITNLGGYYPAIDTVAYSAGEYYYQPVLIMNPDETVASISIQIINAVAGNAIPFAQVSITTAYDTLQETSSNYGTVYFSNIKIPVINNSANYIEAILSISADNYHPLTDTTYITKDWYNWEYQLQPF